TVPLDGTPKALTKTHDRLITEVFLRSRDVCLRMLDVACTRFCINRRDIFAGDVIDLLQHRIHSDSISARHVENLSGNTGNLARKQIGLDDIPYVSEIPRLQAVPVNRRTTAK